MSPEETGEQIVVPIHATRRAMGLEVVLTGAAIGLSIYTLMRMNTLEERVRTLSRGDGSSPKVRSCKLSRAAPSIAEEEVRNDGYETSDEEQEDSEDEEEEPPPSPSNTPRDEKKEEEDEGKEEEKKEPEPEKPKEEPELEEDAPADSRPKLKTTVVVNDFDATLDCFVSGDVLTGLSADGFQYLVSGARANVGIKKGLSHSTLCACHRPRDRWPPRRPLLQQRPLPLHSTSGRPDVRTSGRPNVRRTCDGRPTKVRRTLNSIEFNSIQFNSI